MLFNSFAFALFFPVVFGVYWLLPHRAQNRFLLAASYLFYACWDWRFLALILGCSWVSFEAARRMDASGDARVRRGWLTLALVFNLGVLAFFKYCNFFIDNLRALAGLLGVSLPGGVLAVILPMGISFFTFQAMSYTIDVYRKALRPAGMLSDFMLYVAFFPQLVAGPIERATHLLPQVLNPRPRLTGEDLARGGWLLLLGLFQKIYAADNLAGIVNPVFAAPERFHAPDLFMAMAAFAAQIFCDFAGYSNMARGLGMLLGFRIMRNFNAPFLATNVQEFWNRWHISLSQWIRDYLYFPLMGALKKLPGNFRIYAALMAAMTLMGLWHGAAWHFVVFGVYYGLLLAGYIVLRTHCGRWIVPRSPLGQAAWFAARVLGMAVITMTGMMLFRVPSLAAAGTMLTGLAGPWVPGADTAERLVRLLAFAAPVLALQYWEYRDGDVFLLARPMPWVFRVALTALLTYLVVGWGVMSSVEFIYFQF